MRGDDGEWEGMMVNDSGWWWMKVDDDGEWRSMMVNEGGWWMKVDDGEWGYDGEWQWMIINLAKVDADGE